MFLVCIQWTLSSFLLSRGSYILYHHISVPDVKYMHLRYSSNISLHYNTVLLSGSVFLKLWPAGQIQPMELYHPVGRVPHWSRNMAAGKHWKYRWTSAWPDQHVGSSQCTGLGSCPNAGPVLLIKPGVGETGLVQENAGRTQRIRALPAITHFSYLHLHPCYITLHRSLAPKLQRKSII